MKRRLTRSEKILLLTVLLVGSLYFYVNKIYDPSMRAFEKSRREVESLRAEVAGLGTEWSLRGRLAQARREAGSLEQDVERLMVLKKAQTEREATLVLAEVLHLALASGLDVRNLAFKQARGSESAAPARPAEAFSWQEYGVVVEGSHNELVSFLYHLSEIQKLVVLENLQVKAGSQPGLLEASCILLI